MPSGPPPRINTYDDRNIQTYLSESRSMIMEWYPQAAIQAFADLDPNPFDLSVPNWNNHLWECIRDNHGMIAPLRALCYRHIGRGQFADFGGLGTDTRLKNLEEGRQVVFSIAECQSMADLILREINPNFAPWVGHQRPPTSDEIALANIIISLRINDRNVSTAIRYMHEPRQRDKIEDFLCGLGYQEVVAQDITNPRDMAPGTFAYGVTLESQLDDGSIVNNPVDLLVMPPKQPNLAIIQNIEVLLDETQAPFRFEPPIFELLPIFFELKSMGDTVNANKRHKEEGGKLRWLRNRWSTSENDFFNYFLLVGGTLPVRYLQHEQNQNIDWIYEDRVSALQPIIDWYDQ